MRISDWSSDVCSSDRRKGDASTRMVSVRDILFTLVIVNVDSRERMSDERSQIGDTRPPTGGRVYMKAQLFASASVAALFEVPTTAIAQSSEEIGRASRREGVGKEG